MKTFNPKECKVTRDLLHAEQILKIEVRDQIIVGAGQFTSLRQFGCFDAEADTLKHTPLLQEGFFFGRQYSDTQ